MTDNTMTLLLDQIQASTDGDFLRAIAAHTLQRLMEFEVDGLIGAGRPVGRAHHIPQRLPGSSAGNPARHARPEDPEAGPGNLLSSLSGAPQDRRESPDRRDPGGVDPGRLDTQGR
jgi:hypothetical protein